MQQGRDLARKLFKKKAASSSSSPSSISHMNCIEEDDVEISADVDDAAIEDIWIDFEGGSPSPGIPCDDAETTLFGSAAGQDISAASPLTLWTIPEVASVATGLGVWKSDVEVDKSVSGVESSCSHGGEIGSIVKGIAYFKDSARG